MKKTPLKSGKSLKSGQKPLTSTRGLKRFSEAGKVRKQAKNELMAKMIKVFEEIWSERGPYCECTGRYLGEEPKTTMFHHLLPKSKYPQYALLKMNIVVLHPDVHGQVELDPASVPTVKIWTDLLKRKHLNNEL